MIDLHSIHRSSNLRGSTYLITFKKLTIMWYWIVALIFLALEIAAVAVLVGINNRRNNRGLDLDEVFENFGPVALVLVLGAVAWPLITLIILFVILYNIFLKDVFNKIVDWIDEHL